MFRLIKFVGAVAIASGIALSSGTASAGTGQCYDRHGRQVGPTYDTDHPNASFHRWLKYNGGYCRRIGNDFWGSNNRPYPRAYLAWRSGGGYGRPRPGYGRPGYGGPPPGYGRPGNGRPAYFRAGRASHLISRSYRQRGRAYVRVRDTGRRVYLNGRQWRVFRARFGNGARHRIAARRTGRGVYVALINRGRGWSERRVLGY